MNNTQTLVIGIMAIYTLAIVVGIHKYEAKIKKINSNIIHWQKVGLDHKGQLDQVQNLFQLVHGAKEEVEEHNKVLTNQIGMLKNEISELRSGIYTGYPAPTVSAPISDIRKLQEVWDKGGMGIVNMDIVSPSQE